MAPSNMFSYLRPHRQRTAAASTPSNAAPSANAAYSIPPPPMPSSRPPPSSSSSSIAYPPAEKTPSPPTVSSLPPVLPPIPRVASQYGPKGERRWQAPEPTNAPDERDRRDLAPATDAGHARGQEYAYEQAQMDNSEMVRPVTAGAPGGKRAKGQRLRSRSSMSSIESGRAGFQSQGQPAPDVPAVPRPPFSVSSSQSSTLVPPTTASSTSSLPTLPVAPKPLGKRPSGVRQAGSGIRGRDPGGRERHHHQASSDQESVSNYSDSQPQGRPHVPAAEQQASSRDMYRPLPHHSSSSGNSLPRPGRAGAGQPPSGDEGEDGTASNPPPTSMTNIHPAFRPRPEPSQQGTSFQPRLDLPPLAVPRSRSPQPSQPHYRQSQQPLPPLQLSPTLPERSGKKKVNLLNPLSLLMRRRFGHSEEDLSRDSIASQKKNAAPPMATHDELDFRIRGKVVHDFSAQRPTPHLTIDSKGTGHLRLSDERSPATTDRQHTPVFTERFGDEAAGPEAGAAAIRAEQLANKDFVSRNLGIPSVARERSPGRSPSLLPRAGPNIPPPMPLPLPPASDRIPAPPTGAPPPPPPKDDDGANGTALSPVQESPTLNIDDAQQSSTPHSSRPQSRQSRTSPHRNQSRNVSGSSSVPPIRMSSRASRFSFQFAGGDNIQEKLLEEKHKQRAAAKSSSRSPEPSDDGSGSNRFRDSRLDMDDFDEDTYNFDDMDDGGYDGFEGDDGEFAGFGPMSTSSLPISDTVLPLRTSGGISAMNLNTPLSLSQDQTLSSDGSGRDAVQDVDAHEAEGAEADLGGVQGNGALEPPTSATFNENLPDSTTLPSEPFAKPAAPDSYLDDDMYFDDGIIDTSVAQEDGPKFDESTFDDPSSHLYERRLQSQPQSVNVNQGDKVSAAIDAPNQSNVRTDPLAVYAGRTESPQNLEALLDRAGFHDTSVKNMHAYQSALADAANKAAADGRFRRQDSADTESTVDYSPQSAGLNRHTSTDDSPHLSSRPSLVPDDSRFSQETTFSPPMDGYDGSGHAFHGLPAYDHGFDSSCYNDDFNDFDGMEDDPMIALANADALANDLDGEYGQEFGFFAQGSGADMVNGGFFGPRDLGRSQSGRNAVREPNLTPITERSEYSTRNSFISVSHFGQQCLSPIGHPSAGGMLNPAGLSAVGGPLTSPGIAQLARIRSPYADDDSDISLSQLQRLRQRAFGGSQSSLHSGNSSPRDSPGPYSHHMMPTNNSSGSSLKSVPVPGAHLSGLSRESQSDQKRSPDGTHSDESMKNSQASIGLGLSGARTSSSSLERVKALGSATATSSLSNSQTMDQQQDTEDLSAYEDDDLGDYAAADVADLQGDYSSPSEPASPTIMAAADLSTTPTGKMLSASSQVGLAPLVLGQQALHGSADAESSPESMSSSTFLGSPTSLFPMPPSANPHTTTFAQAAALSAGRIPTTAAQLPRLSTSFLPPINAGPRLSAAKLSSPTTPFTPLSLSSPTGASLAMPPPPLPSKFAVVPPPPQSHPMLHHYGHQHHPPPPPQQRQHHPTRSSGGSSHSRNSSAADSVTYVKLDDGADDAGSDSGGAGKGGDRWVLERRRTAESGEVEVVERTVVEGGRI